MDKIASRAEAVAKMNPTKDSTEVIVRSFGETAHRVQPQISTAGETRYPSANSTPTMTWTEVLNGKNAPASILIRNVVCLEFGAADGECASHRPHWHKLSYTPTSFTCVAKYQIFPNGSVTAPLRSPYGWSASSWSDFPPAASARR